MAAEHRIAKTLPMAVTEIRTDLSMSFEFPTEPGQSLFFLMQRPKSELFKTFITRFERNIAKRWKAIDPFFALITAGHGPAYEQKAMEEMELSHVLAPGNTLFVAIPVDNNSGQHYRIQFKSPRVAKFAFPKRFFINHYILPKLSIDEGSCEDSKFTWSRRQFDFKKKVAFTDWERVDCKDYALMLGPNDLAHQFRLEIEPYRGTVNGVRSVFYTNTTPEILTCAFNYLSRCPHTFSRAAGKQFRVVSYNLLAEMYTDTKESKEMFAYCRKEFLEFSYRKALLSSEILSYQADLYILQEVDSSFHNSLYLLLKKKNFDSKYVPKSNIREGCAIFFNKSRFTLVKSMDFTIKSLLDEPRNVQVKDALSRNNDHYEQLIKLPNVFMVTILMDQQCNRRLVVANTHLYAGEFADTIRFVQSYLCFTYLADLIKIMDDCSLVFGGDFNSTPDTCVLELMRNSVKLSRFREYNSELQSDWEPPLFDPNFDIMDLIDYEFILDLKLTSACGLPQYTNYTRNFVGCLDYIFYDDRKLSVADVVPLPSHQAVIENEAIPSEKFPSDHLPLICTLEYR